MKQGAIIRISHLLELSSETRMFRYFGMLIRLAENTNGHQIDWIHREDELRSAPVVQHLSDISMRRCICHCRCFHHYLRFMLTALFLPPHTLKSNVYGSFWVNPVGEPLVRYCWNVQLSVTDNCFYEQCGTSILIVLVPWPSQRWSACGSTNSKRKLYVRIQSML